MPNEGNKRIFAKIFLDDASNSNEAPLLVSVRPFAPDLVAIIQGQATDPADEKKFQSAYEIVLNSFGGYRKPEEISNIIP